MLWRLRFAMLPKEQSRWSSFIRRCTSVTWCGYVRLCHGQPRDTATTPPLPCLTQTIAIMKHMAPCNGPRFSQLLQDRNRIFRHEISLVRFTSTMSMAATYTELCCITSVLVIPVGFAVSCASSRKIYLLFAGCRHRMQATRKNISNIKASHLTISNAGTKSHYKAPHLSSHRSKRRQLREMAGWRCCTDEVFACPPRTTAR